MRRVVGDAEARGEACFSLVDADEGDGCNIWGNSGGGPCEDDSSSCCCRCRAMAGLGDRRRICAAARW